MKATELRIGNIVSMGCNLLSQVKSVNSHVAKLRLNGGLGGEIKTIFCGGEAKCKYDEIKPIPITEEWLLRFGFEKSVDGSLKLFLDPSVYPDFDFVYNNGEFKLSNDSEHCTTLWKLNIEYVHQLQNLYFALTGEELTINNNS